jgi:hypothetical protein
MGGVVLKIKDCLNKSGRWILKLSIEILNFDCGMFFALVGVVMLFLLKIIVCLDFLSVGSSNQV